jgi:DNA-binding MarR family transcriptional regulator
MKQDFLRSLGYLGFVTRMKRLSDHLLHDGKRLYNELDLDIEPNWYLVFELLKQKGPMSVTEIAEYTQLAHPSVITITNKMMENGYLLSEKDTVDSRRRVLDLSERAIKMLPDFEKVWDAGVRGVELALEGMNALEHLEKLERKYEEKGFLKRTKEQLKRPNK